MGKALCIPNPESGTFGLYTKSIVSSRTVTGVLLCETCDMVTMSRLYYYLFLLCGGVGGEGKGKGVYCCDRVIIADRKRTGHCLGGHTGYLQDVTNLGGGGRSNR